MLREDREAYISEVFPQNFEQYKDRKIAIYGAGPYTGYVLNQFPDYNIVGVLDDTKSETTLFNRPKITMQDVLDLHAEILIVIAGAASTKIIFKKILNPCLENGIGIYNVYGKNLVDLYCIGNLALPDSEYFNVSEDQLRQAIDEHECISFDIFDTLIMRKTLHPQDVFAILGWKAEQAGIRIDGFAEKRADSEREMGFMYPNLFEIYECFQKKTGITDEQKERLIQLELDTERSLLMKRDKMAELFDYAKQHGKRVFLISDMYLTKPILSDVLSGLGIEGYEDILVSCDYRKSKYTGLYDEYKKRANAGSYLHIGDNEDADGYSAKMCDMDVFIIKSALELLRLSSFREIENSLHTINEKSIVGMVVATVFQNPFAFYGTDGRPVITEAYDIGYVYVGAIMSNFILWLLDTLRTGGYEDVLFSARDGYLIQKLYEIAVKALQYKDVPKGIYMLISRSACIAASIESKTMLRQFAETPFGCPPEEMLIKRFRLTPEEILPYEKGKYNSIGDYALAHKDRIFRKSKTARENFCTYLKKLGLEKEKSYAIFDFVSSGTCQYLLGLFSGYQTVGTYFCRYHAEDFMQEKEKLPILSYIRNGYYSDVGSRFFANYIFLETVMTSDQGSLYGFDCEGNPVFEEDQRTEEQFRYEHDIRKGIEDFLTVFLENLYVPGETINIEVCDMLYGLKDNLYTNLQCRILDELHLMDNLLFQPITVVY